MPAASNRAASQPRAQHRHAASRLAKPSTSLDVEQLSADYASAGDRIDGLAACVSILKQRSRLELRRILAECYVLLHSAGAAPSKLAEVDAALRRRGADFSNGREQALIWTVFRPADSEEKKRTAKYARTLVKLRQWNATPVQAKALLASPGIEVLSNMNARQPDNTAGEAPKPFHDAGPATPAANQEAVALPPAVWAALKEEPTGWVPLEGRLTGPNSKPIIRLARKRH